VGIAHAGGSPCKTAGVNIGEEGVTMCGEATNMDFKPGAKPALKIVIK
jgi:hypothetical protein